MPVLRSSLRVRLTLAFAGAMTAILFGLGAFLYVRLAADLLTGVDQNLRSRATAAAARPADPAVLGAGPLVDADEAFGQVLNRRGQVLDSTTAVAEAPLLPARTVASLAAPVLLTRRVVGIEEPVRLLGLPIGPDGSVVLVVGATLGDRGDALRRLLVLYALAGPAALALSSLVGWTVAGAALRPVERMRRTAERLSDRDSAGRLPVPATGDELSRLAATLNTLLDRMHAALRREHRFVDDASHELRTPLAVLKAELDLAVSRPRQADELQQTLRSAARETDRLVRLAEDLLVLARARGGQLPVLRSDVDLHGVLDEAVAPFRDRAEPQEQALVRVSVGLANAHLDPVRLRQAVHNLVDNALTHGRPPVRVHAEAEQGGLLVEVSDGGDGFPQDLIAIAFEPFTRAQTSSTAPGSGLGLAVVAAVAQAHGGTATAGNNPGGGAYVRLHLPS